MSPLSVLRHAPRAHPHEVARLESLLDPVGQSATFQYVPAGRHTNSLQTGTAMVTATVDNSEGLPSGFVTFVFTDIEESTRLYKALGEDAAGDVFDLHNEQLRAAWTGHNGHEVHTEGDSFFVAFENTDDAVAACIDVQQRIAATPWPEDGIVRVRIGIHSGLAAPRNDDYMALSVHQAARVMSAAHGGQILITDSTAQILSAEPDGQMHRVGTYRLRDFDEAPLLRRIDAAGVPPNEASPRATPAAQHNLVAPLTSFVGRDADVVTVNGLLAPGRAVTLVGPGGMGKTRLATEVGIEVAPTWDGGVWMVELAEIMDPDLIDDEIADAIGVAGAGLGDRWHDVIDHIGDSTMLMILDNAEHVIERTAELVVNLLRGCPNLSVLATSREPLNCAGEVLYRVRPLDSTDPGDDPTQLPAVELFIDRAHAVAPQLAWTSDALDDVAAICASLDGLPLAIEIAAAQIRVRQLGEIRAGLSDRFRLLRSRSRDLPDRQRTMEGLLGWSYRLLDETEQRAFCRLAVFAGSFSIDAAEASLAGDGINADDVPELIWTLVDKSLISADLSESATRYRLFETVQQYAMRQLIDNDDPVRCAVALGEWLLGRMAPWSPTDSTWLGHVAVELANVRSVVELAGGTRPEMVHQLMCSVGRYHDAVQGYQSGIDELERAAHAVPDHTPSRVALLAEIAHLYLRMAKSDQASTWLDEADKLHGEVGPPTWNDVAVQRVRGEMAIRARDYPGAIDVAETALESPISELGAARMWSAIGIARSSEGNLVDGLAALQQALAIYVELGETPQISLAHANVAEAALRLENYPLAARHQRHCLEDALAIGQPLAIATSLTMAGYLADRRGEWSDAVRMLSSASQMLESAGHRPYDEEATMMADTLSTATNALGASAVEALGEQGSSMSVFDAAALAFATFDASAESTAASGHRND